jgi:galactokinase
VRGPPERVVAFGPGRANLIGEHTDYNDGLSLPFALAAGVTVTAAPGGDGGIVVRALDRGETDRFELAADPSGPAGGWRDFVRGTVAELLRAGFELRPAELAIEGTVPAGAGLSSSAALGTALALALLAHSGQPPPARLALARLCSCVENDWVGARTGLLDQIASLYGAAGHALRVDFRSLDVRPVRLALGGWRLVAVPSGESRSIAESGYNERRAECERACELLGVASLRDADAGSAARLPAPLSDRVRHVLAENARVEAAVRALERGDLTELGRLLDDSHRSLRDLYATSTAAVERTAERLRRGGAAGARMIGGGFGGSVMALFPPDSAPPADAVALEPAAGARLLALECCPDG